MKVFCTCIALIFVLLLMGCAKDSVRDFDAYEFGSGSCKGHVSLDIWSGQIAEGDVYGLFSVYFQFEDTNGYVVIEHVEIKDEVGHTYFSVRDAQLETRPRSGSDVIYAASVRSEKTNYPFASYIVSGAASYYSGRESVSPLKILLDGQIRTRVDRRNSFISKF